MPVPELDKEFTVEERAKLETVAATAGVGVAAEFSQESADAAVFGLNQSIEPGFFMQILCSDAMKIFGALLLAAGLAALLLGIGGLVIAPLGEWLTSTLAFSGASITTALLAIGVYYAASYVLQNKATRYIDHFIFDIGKVFVDIDVTNTKILDAFNALTIKYGVVKTPQEVKGIFETHQNSIKAFHNQHPEVQKFREFVKEKLGICATNMVFDQAYRAANRADAFSKLLRQPNLPPLTAAQVEAIFVEHAEQLAAFQKPGDEIIAFRTFLKEALGLPQTLSDEEFDEAYTASILPNQAETVRQRLEYLKHLRDLGYKIILFSNNNPIHRELLRKQFDADNWHRYFDAQYFSNDYPDLYKPDNSAYERIWSEQSLTRSRGIFFDDMPVNVEAARKLGGNAEVFTVANDMREVLRFATEITKKYKQSMTGVNMHGLWMQVKDSCNVSRRLGVPEVVTMH